LELLTASVADAQESGHLSVDYLKQATPLIHSPQGLEPRNADVFIHNEGWIDSSPDIVWAKLIDVSQWPRWYSNSADMRIEGGQPQFGIGVSFNGKTFGFPIRTAGPSIIRYSSVQFDFAKEVRTRNGLIVLCPVAGTVRARSWQCESAVHRSVSPLQSAHL
jgi:hypothetical protein